MSRATLSADISASPTVDVEVRPRSALTPLLNGLVPLFDALGLVVALAWHPGARWLGLLYALLAMVTLTLAGEYRCQIAPTLGNTIPSLLGHLAVPLVVIGGLRPAGEATAALLRSLPLAVGLVVAGRAVSYAVIRATRARGVIVEPTLIIGSGALGEQMARTLREHPEYGLVPIGFLDGFPQHERLELPILGGVEDLDRVLDERAVRRVIVAFGSMREPEMVPVLRACDRHHVEVHVMPRFFELGVTPGWADTDDIWGIPLLRLRRSALRTVAWRTKRGFDLLVGTITLVVAAPLFGLLALAVRLTSPGPVFFRQQRVGQQGRPFKLLKFRTLHVNNDSDTCWTVTDPECLTPIGRFLRATSLDELPQLLNIIRGDMSVVGPRPERPYFVNRFATTVPRYDDRHRVPVGLTGWAQVHGLRGDTSIEQRARFDNFYIEHWSLWRDIVICLRTLSALRPRSAATLSAGPPAGNRISGGVGPERPSTKRRVLNRPVPIADIPVVILCGGLGTRLREATERVPKPLVDIGEKPILWHVMKLYGHHGFRRFVLALGYRAADIKHYFLSYRENLADFTLHLKDDHQPVFHNAVGNEDWEVTCVETGLMTATGARVKRVESYIDTETFAVTYGDGIGAVDLAAELAFHRAHGSIGTVTAVHPTSRYGEMHVAGEQVVEFNEKPTMAEGFVSAGFFFFERAFLDRYLTQDPGLFLEHEPLRRLASDGQLRQFTHEGFWMGMDTFRDYTELNHLWSTGEAPWRVWPD